MKNTIKIQPVSIELNTIKIMVEYDMGSGATFHYSLVADNGIPFESGFIKLTESEFNSWGTDDNYIEDLILSKLNLQRA